MKSDCIHHWDVEPNGIGRCRKCGEFKQFPSFENISTPFRRQRPTQEQLRKHAEAARALRERIKNGSA